jgi:hypothetical protein
MMRSALRLDLKRSLLFCLVAACGDDGNGKGEQKDLTEGLEEFEPYKFSELELPYETSDQCIMHGEEERDDTSAESECMCNQCLELMQECDVLPGCVEIVACAMESGCRDEFFCYLIPGAPCTETIDRWGNATLATAVSVALLDCAMDKECR